MTQGNGPLQGYTVLELGSTIAGPFCGRLLADFGADVIKVEIPEGDPLRSMSPSDNGRALYAATSFRGKANVSIDLRKPDGQKLARALALKSDIVLENFRPGTLERWGLGYEQLSRDNPGLVMVRISGFGQTGPYRERPGFGIIGESVGGLRELTGDPDRPPSRVAVSLTDNLTGLYGAFGAAMALLQRGRTGVGQVVDCALYEAAFSFMDGHVATYDRLGIVPSRAGSRLSNHVPNNLYLSRDRVYVHVAAGNQSVFERLAAVIGRPDLVADERFATLAARNRHPDEVDELLGAWIGQHDALAIEERFGSEDIPCCRILRLPDIFADPQFAAREMIVPVEDPGIGTVRMPGIVPKLSATPGRIRWSGRLPGENTRGVLRSLCGLDDAEIDRLVADRIVFQQGES
jgi:crotonobetainyl-CoA:carnitine CoA-transferase CaiB-like acyl-CoA transferase